MKKGLIMCNLALIRYSHLQQCFSQFTQLSVPEKGSQSLACLRTNWHFINNKQQLQR